MERARRRLTSGGTLDEATSHAPEPGLLDVREQRFEALFGEGRGDIPRDDLRRHSEQLTRILARDGIEGGIRFYRSEYRRMTPSGSTASVPLAEVGSALATELIAESYTRQRELLCAWTHAIAARPEKCLNIVSDGWVLHLLPNGQHYATNNHLNEHNELAACGHAHKSWIPVKRGTWAARGSCPDCAQYAGDYPETAAEDESIPIPAPALRFVYREWEERVRPQLFSGLALGSDITDLRGIADTELPHLVIDWAADIFARCPYIHALRALRSPGGYHYLNPDSFQVAMPEQIAKRIAAADLSAADYRKLLVAHHRDESWDTAGGESAYAQMLLGVARA